ncbi:uncharacterized protein KY384_008562 [Bacidia gigantensis]|uniref:uncharacterized protein n=1 Tax=Bacidia gigantensis TaxID=2732470 RepID=UPI001D03686C|nr:uncharacterized protein KY384_008562 [Bacidia gigantensis]KAG8527133.1 hypothetical protein KY384_008562 [Bacidia gigantensis]
MPHVYKSISSHQLQLLDRSPVQTPVHTSANTPNATPSPSPSLLAKACKSLPDLTDAPHHASTAFLLPHPHENAPAPYSRGSPSRYDVTLATQAMPFPMAVSKAPDFKGHAADKVSFLDRSPVQTAFHTRTHSPSGQGEKRAHPPLRAHSHEEAAETVKKLRESFKGRKLERFDEDEGSEGAEGTEGADPEAKAEADAKKHIQ